MKQKNINKRTRTADCRRSVTGRLLFLSLLLFTFLGGARAQEFYAGETGRGTAPYEVQIGEGTSTIGYFPFYTLYDYSIAECLFLASELTEAGVLPGEMTSLSWYATNETGYEQQGISFWMANVSDEALTTTSHLTTDMTLVYTGSVTPATGWNEFVFNEGTFTWDGSSNVLIFCQRNNGAWNSTINWQAGDVGFTAMAYRYQDSGAYDVTVTNTMYTSNLRPNIIIKGVGGASSSCPTPLQFAVSNVTSRTADLAWESDASAWQIMLNDDDTNLIDVTTTSYTLTALTPATSYNVKVRANCGGGDYSGWASRNFTTPVACPVPTDLNATLTPGDGSVATLSWTEPGGATAWVLEYGTAEDFTGATSVTVNDTPSANLTGLTAETTYYARVKAVCGGEDGESQWINTISFTPTDAYSITVNDGTNTNGYVPIYGWYAELFSKSQFVIPAADLADMQWGTINKLTFYASNANVSWGAAEFEVYMTEVDYTTFEGTTLVDWTTMDKVMSAGSLSIVDNVMEVTLDAPYQYMGGNLLIGILQTTSGSYATSTWYGVSQEGTTALGGYEDSKAISSQSFLPKTTFAYIPGEEPTCFKPTNLAVSNISTNSADLSWDGTSDNYVLQYRTAAHDNMNLWEQVGEDVIATATLTQYTFDLSSYSGTGNIAIRHYNISDMFRLAVDDIVVTNANGDEVVSEDFENGSIPSGWTNYDYDGDGYVWNPVNFDSEDIQNGSYCVSSASWDQNYGALTPDNWLIISNVELGGTLTLYARGVDANFPQENFGVFVTTESLETVFGTTPAGSWSAEIPTTDTSYGLTGLTGDMPYEWKVKGVCGEGDESSWASSSFTTLPEGFKTFITAGAWDVADNWFPAGVPTSEDEVSIEAAVTIPAGVVATARRATLNGGSILIKDGGQLKQGAATLRVTIEKEITGYGEETGKYSFISSPFTGRTLYEASGTWSRVDNLLDGDYDFYAFDSSADLEWINYEASPTHISFESSNGNSGLMYGEGYLYANAEDKTLQFVGTTGKSIDYTETRDVIYDETSTDAFNGWQLVGNFFSCNAYVYFANEDGNLLPATFYKMNADGDGLVKVDGNVVELKPCESAFLVVNTSGKIVYSSEPVEADGEVVSVAMLPLLPEHGLDADQDAEPFTLTLQNDSEDNYTLIMDYHGHTVNVALAGRTLWKDGNWNTLTLPFNVDITADGCPLAGADARELVSAEYDGTTLQLTFTGENEVDMIQAGIPYIIKWDSGTNIEDPVFNNVTINSSVSNKDFDLGDGNSIEFKGTYDMQTYRSSEQSILFLGENNTLYWPEPDMTDSTNPIYPTIGACRAYFELTGFTTAAAAGVRFMLNFGNGGEATGIVSAKVSGDARDSWYTVDGVKLNGAPKRKGLYIHNGTKVVIK